MAFSPITSGQIDGETMETVTDFIFLGSKINADGDNSHKIKRHLLLGRKTMTHLSSVLKIRDLTLLIKVSLEKAMAPHSSILAWRIPWMEEPGRLQSMGSLRVRSDWATSLPLFTFMHWRRKWQPTPVSCLENPRDRGAWWAAIYAVTQNWTQLMQLSSSSSSSQSYGFFSSHAWTWRLDHKEGWTLKNWCFWTVVLEKILESPLDWKEIKPVSPKENQSWTFITRTDAEAPILWPPDAKSRLIRKDPDAENDWRQEEKGMTEYEMVGWIDGWMSWWIINSMDMSLNKVWEMVKDRKSWHGVVHGVAKSWTQCVTEQQWPNAKDTTSGNPSQAE